MGYRIVVAGATGNVGREVLAILAERQFPIDELAAVASRTNGNAQAFASRHGVPKAFGSYREMLESDDIDVVYIATPHPQHRDVALMAIDNGKAVLVGLFNSTWGNLPAAVSWQSTGQQLREDAGMTAKPVVNAAGT